MSTPLNKKDHQSPQHADPIFPLSFILYDYIFITERVYFSATELQQTSQTCHCPAVFVRIIILLLYDESLYLQINHLSWMLKPGGKDVFEVKSVWKKQGMLFNSQTKYLLLLKLLC